MNNPDFHKQARDEFAVMSERYPKLSEQVILRYNARLKRAAGRFIVDYEKSTMSIEYANLSNMHEYGVRELIRHEVAHFLAYRYYGNLSHDGEWKYIASFLHCVPSSYATDSERVQAYAASLRSK